MQMVCNSARFEIILALYVRGSRFEAFVDELFDGR